MKATACVLLIALGFAVALLSDLLIRARGLDGKFGIDASAYDGLSLAAILVGGLALLTTLFEDHKESR